MIPLRTVAIAAAISILVGVTAGAGASSVTDEFHPVEAITGALLGAAFFAVSGVVVARARVEELKGALLISYVVKATTLASVGLLLAFVDVDRATLATSIVTAAFAYLAATVVLDLRTRRARKSPG